MNDLEEIGALWSKRDKNDEPFLSGQIEVNGEKKKILVFKNKHRKEDKHPNYRIFLSDGPPKKKDFEDEDVPF